jgi:predicted AAA+ superfamily ATPase
VVAEILKSFLHNGRKAPLYFYRDKDKLEIDLLIFRDGTLHPLEIKKTASPSKHDVRHFAALKKLGLPTGAGGLVCFAEQDLPLTESVQCIPAAAL